MRSGRFFSPSAAWLDRHCRCRHLIARFGALTTALGAFLHEFIITKLLTGEWMKVGVAQPKIGACLANLGTVDQQPNVSSFRMAAPHGETISYCAFFVRCSFQPNDLFLHYDRAFH